MSTLVLKNENAATIKMRIVSLAVRMAAEVYYCELQLFHFLPLAMLFLQRVEMSVGVIQLK